MPTSDPEREYLLKGIKSGFRITTGEYSGETVFQQNYRSATCPENVRAVEEQIKTELENGRYVQCATPSPLVSALGAIPKPERGKIRLIHDCSRPHGGALNDYTTAESFKYQSLNDAKALIQPGDFVGKIDLSNAYRSVKIHPDDYPFTGLTWKFERDENGTFMIDTRLPFGAAASPKILNDLTQAVRRIMAARGRCGIVAYLDDFLCIGRTYQECLAAMTDLMAVLRKLGFSINYNKVEGPAMILTFLGVQINTLDYTLSLLERKLKELQQEAFSILGQKQISKRGLQSIVGKLNWGAQIILGGRQHMRRLKDRINSLQSPRHKSRITTCMQEDLLWWIRNANQFNGITPIAENRPVVSVCTDACDSGGGAYHQGEWCHVAWIDWPEVAALHINYKEVMALVPAVCLWGHTWRGQRVYVYCDNQAAVGIFNRGTAKDPLVMDALRNVFMASMVHDFRIHAIYYPGKQNIVADAASRLSDKGGWEKLMAALSHTYMYL